MPSGRRLEHSKAIVAYAEREQQFASKAAAGGPRRPIGKGSLLPFSVSYSPHNDLPPVAEMSIDADTILTYLFRRLLYQRAIILVARKLGVSVEGRDQNLAFERRDDVQRELSVMIEDNTIMFRLITATSDEAYAILDRLRKLDWLRALQFAIDDSLLEGQLRLRDELREARGAQPLEAKERNTHHQNVMGYHASILASRPKGRRKGGGNSPKFKFSDFEQAVLRAREQNSEAIQWKHIADIMGYSPEALKKRIGRYDKEALINKGYSGRVDLEGLVTEVMIKFNK